MVVEGLLRGGRMCIYSYSALCLCLCLIVNTQSLNNRFMDEWIVLK